MSTGVAGTVSHLETRDVPNGSDAADTVAEGLDVGALPADPSTGSVGPLAGSSPS